MKNSIFFALFFTLFITLSLIPMRGPFPDFTDCITLPCPTKLIYGFDGRAVRVDDVILRSGKKDCRAYALSAIQEAGYYKLAGNVTTTITIAASGVQLNLGGFTVTGGITVNSNLKDITINNGTVIPGAVSNAVTINSGCTSIKIFDVSVQDSGTVGGILMTQAVDSTIRNCEMIQNTTGIMLNQCSNITVQDCAATRNIFAGFSLLTSNTCIVTGCKAISTGADNTFITLTNALGFVSNNGVGNVFDKCIANSTQALTTTDSNSLIAGFALRGTEKGTRITNCTAADTATSIGGATIPYGIVLQATVSATLTPTGNPPVPNDTNSAVGLTVSSSWSPDGKYFAVCANIVSVGFRVYAFNRKTVTFTQVAQPNIPPAALPARIAWSPSGQFIAVATSTTDANRVKIYKFDPVNNSCQLFAVPNVAPTLGAGPLSWHPSEKFLIVGANTNTTLYVYSFDRIARRLTQLSLLVVTGANISALALSPDGQYCVVLFTGTVGIAMYKFNQATGKLTSVATIGGLGSIGGGQLFWISWNPNGLYFSTLDSGRDLLTFQFDRTANVLTLINTTDMGVAQGSPDSGSWSPDGQYVATGPNASNRFRVFAFNQQANSFTGVAAGSPVGLTSPRSLSWHPSGEFLTAADGSNSNQLFYCISALTFPSQNTITNNTVYCNSGNSTNTQSGIGISGSSMSNYIAQNTVYSDPINPPIASLNYAFCTNVFNPIFQDIPTLMQNIEITSCAPIPARPDRVQQMEILLSKLTDIATKVDLIKLK